MKIFNKISCIDEFKKDLKKLIRRFKTLEDDLDIFIKSQLKMYHKLEIDNRGIFKINDLDITYPEIYKAKKFACRSLKGKGVKSGIRTIYAYFKNEEKIELIEIYYKQDKENDFLMCGRYAQYQFRREIHNLLSSMKNIKYVRNCK